MRTFVGPAAVALALVPAAPAAADELEPSGDWSLDYADDSCALRRTFGEGEERVWLEIMQLAPRYPARVTIAGTDFTKKRKKAALDQTPILRFLPAGTDEQYSLFAFGDYGEGLQGLAVYAPLERTLPSVDAAPAVGSGTVPMYLRGGRPFPGHSKNSNAIALLGAFERDLILKTGDLERPFEAMRACMDDLTKQWDVAMAKGITLSQAPLPRNLETWAEPIMDRFPRGLRRFADQVTIRARVIVGADGKAEQCRIVEPVVDAEYEQRTCGVILSAGEYEPARDAAGRPVRELYIQNIVYRSEHVQRRAAAAARQKAGETAAATR